MHNVSVLHIGKKNNMYKKIYKNIIWFFSCFFIVQNVRMGRVRESRWWRKCIHTGATVQFFCETSLLPSSGFEIFPGLNNFPGALVVKSPTNTLHVDMPLVLHAETYSDEIPASCLLKETRVLPVVFLLPACDSSSMPPTQFPWHFRLGICVLFTEGNRSVSCYATHAIYAVFQMGSLS